MNHFRIAVITLAVFVLASNPALARVKKKLKAKTTNGTSSSSSSAAAVAAPASSTSSTSEEGELSKYHLKKGMKYDEAKAILAKEFWAPVVDTQDPTRSQNYPEVSCGQGKESMCSVTFRKDGQEVALSLENLSEPGTEDYRVEATY